MAWSLSMSMAASSAPGHSMGAGPAMVGSRKVRFWMPKSGTQVQPNGMAGTIQRPIRAALAWPAACPGLALIYGADVTAVKDRSPLWSGMHLPDSSLLSRGMEERNSVKRCRKWRHSLPFKHPFLKAQDLYWLPHSFRDTV